MELAQESLGRHLSRKNTGLSGSNIRQSKGTTMQPNSNRKPDDYQQQPAPNSGQNEDLSLSDFLPGVFDEPFPPVQKPFVPTPIPAQPIIYAATPSAYAPPSQSTPQYQTNERARSWVEANFEDTSSSVATITTASGDTTVAPVATRLRKQLPFLRFFKPGRWLIFVAMVLFALLIGLTVSLLYLNNVIGAVAPSNGVLDAYPGGSRVNLNDQLSGFIYQVDKSLPPIAKSLSVPEVSNDSTSKIVDSYNSSLAAKGFRQVVNQGASASATTATAYGPLTALTYTNGKQTVRVEIVTMAGDSTALGLKKGQNLIILVASTLSS